MHVSEELCCSILSSPSTMNVWLCSDPVRTYAYGTDASFYRLNPKLVVKVHTEDEMRRILPIAKKHGVPVTFRAAGTSLSGQAITDSVLLKISHTGKNFRNYQVHVSGGNWASDVNICFDRMKHRVPWSCRTRHDRSLSSTHILLDLTG